MLFIYVSSLSVYLYHLSIFIIITNHHHLFYLCTISIIYIAIISYHIISIYQSIIYQLIIHSFIYFPLLSSIFALLCLGIPSHICFYFNNSPFFSIHSAVHCLQGNGVFLFGLHPRVSDFISLFYGFHF